MCASLHVSALHSLYAVLNLRVRILFWKVMPGFTAEINIFYSMVQKKLTMANFSFISTGQSVKCFYNSTVYILLKLEVVYYKLSEVQTPLTFGF